MSNIFFSSWESIFRSAVVTILAFIGIVVLLRIYGKRTLSKMHAFEFIITIALGSVLSTTALNKNVALVDGILVFFLLMFMQFAITWLFIRIKTIREVVTNQPTLLLYKGEINQANMKKERITMEELYAVARKKGFEKLEDIDMIIFENNGKLNVIPKISSKEVETMKNVVF